nr:hypothetical protein I302_08632 [Kwoniella bestiolae CBS 10118]OCF21853.1 hypothetical protein I302_08632 [Kwoniella bestiolae CBS 10118]
MEVRSSNALCPDGLTPCNILDGAGLAYECIDTDQELESCGGCRYGTFLSTGDQNHHSADCSAMEGVAIGGATCHKGVCLVSQCQDEYTTDGKRCVQT